MIQAITISPVNTALERDICLIPLIAATFNHRPNTTEAAGRAAIRIQAGRLSRGPYFAAAASTSNAAISSSIRTRESAAALQ